MKKLVSLLALGMLHIGFVSGQNVCCPYLGTIEIIPENPTVNDNIYLATLVTTPNLGENLGYEIIQNDRIIVIAACYYIGFSLQPWSFYDTISLGKKQAGIYGLNYIARLSSKEDTCDLMDRSSTHFVFRVSLVSSVESPSQDLEVTCFPNLVLRDKTIIRSNQRLNTIEIFNSFGERLLNKSDIQKKSIEIDMSKFAPGTYFVKIIDQYGGVTIRKIIKV